MLYWLEAKMKQKKNYRELFSLGFFLLIVLLTLLLFSQRKIFWPRAEERATEIIFDTAPGETLPRIWNNFSQGGEEQGLALKPAAVEIKKLQPHCIRIDHVFDFPNLDQRVEEIISLGATPFLSLSYFPATISSEITQFPPSLNNWQILIEETVQRFSGRQEKNLLDVYYEVWNEPDLFGSMTPQDYFTLYRSSVEAANRCQDCQPFKIGGPALTSLKTNWLSDFFKLVSDSQTRLDFFSWHSYQKDPKKTLSEIERGKKLLAESGLFAPLIISEWGSTPEVSPLHDSYFDAAHAGSTIALTLNDLQKIFAFELKDGPDPAGAQYWGRWGLLTHESPDIIPKPRYFTFFYLNQLLEKELPVLVASPEINAIGSTDGKERFTLFLVTPPGRNTTVDASLTLRRLPPGIYLINTYLLAEVSSNPLTPVSREVSHQGGDFSFQQVVLPDSVTLIELSRLSPTISRVSGRSGEEKDLAVRAFDDLKITLGDQLLYEKDFNQALP